MTAYRPLTEQEAIEYARRLPDLFKSDAQLTSREIGDGNLNLVFHITDPNSEKSVIIKQALPYAKVVGESWPLTLDRARIESEALMLQHSFCPELVPTVYQYDKELALTAMVDLSDHVIMRKGLIQGNHYPFFPQHIGRFLANTLFYTSDLGMNQQDKKQLVKKFVNPELCKITEDLIFDHPYTDADTNSFDPQIRDAVEQLWADTALHLEVAKLRDGFLTKAEALLHGDLHTGSIFVTSNSTKVIDPEFAFYGPMGFDIGAVFANLLLNYAGQEGWKVHANEREEYRVYLLDTIRDIWHIFEEQFRSLWNNACVDRIAKTTGYQDWYMARLLQDTFGYTGCKMVRRVIGLSHVADIDTIPDGEAKERAQRLALKIGQALILHHGKAASIEEMIQIARNAE